MSMIRMSQLTQDLLSAKTPFCNVIKSIFSGDLTSPLSCIKPRESSLQMSEMTLKFFAIDNSP